MISLLIASCWLCATLLMAQTPQGGPAAPTMPVPYLSLPYFQGRWYQMYASILPNVTIERSLYCISLDFTLISEESLSSMFCANEGGPGGPRIHMSGGSLNQPDPSTPGKLTCSMNMQCPICPDVPLWVVGLGPLYLNQYEWTIITDPKLLNLFILTRDVNRFETYYKDHVLSLVTAMGFINCINEPHPTYQGEACQYTS